jgi:very-short-patch-repair endonuclease
MTPLKPERSFNLSVFAARVRGGITNENGVHLNMAGKPRSRPTDRLISELAARHFGVVARWELLAAGVTASQIDWRLKTGRLREIHRGVYLVGAVAPPLAYEQAALLAFRNEGRLSHWTAASVWCLSWRPGEPLPSPPSVPVWVTLPPGRGARRPGIKLHRANLDRRDIRKRQGLAVTSPPRTILDMAALLDKEDLEGLVAEAHFRRLASKSELRDHLARHFRKRGTAKLRSVLSLPGGPQRTRSRPERWMLRLLREARITGFKMNTKIHGFEVDVLWPEVRFAIEIDGWDAHSGRTAFERDHLKRATLTAHGITVMPVTGRQIRGDPRGVMDRIQKALAATEAR